MIPVEIEHTTSSAVTWAERFCQGRAIANPADYSIAGNDLSAIKTKMKELDELRRSMTKPLDDSKKKIMEFFRRPLEALQMAETALKSSMLGYSHKIAEEERLRRESASRSDELQIETSLAAKGVSYVTHYKYEITDEKLIPREWLMIDSAKIGLAVRGMRGEIAIPGVRIFSEKSVSARGL